MLQRRSRIYPLAISIAAILTGSAHAGRELSEADITNDSKYKKVFEEPKQLSGSISAGYSSRYIFRGTNLMPSANGMIYTDLHLNYGGLTIGAWIGTQQGTAEVPGALSISEGGGGGMVSLGGTRGAGLQGLGGQAITGQQLAGFIGNNFGLTPGEVRSVFSDVLGVTIPDKITQIKQSSSAFQDRFNEIDLYVQYQFALGPVDVTVGNIFFYIDRDSQTRITAREYFASEDARDLITTLSGGGGLGLLPGNTRVGHPEDLLLNNGRKFSKTYEGIGDERFDRVFLSLSTNAIPYIVPRVTYYQTIYNEGKNADPELGIQRNDRKGGYLELKVNGEIPIIKDRLNFDPYALVSYSAGDRTASDGSSLDGWNHVQVGAELVWQVTDNFRIIPAINYMNHIADPPLGTNKDEWWGGARAEITFGGPSSEELAPADTGKSGLGDKHVVMNDKQAAIIEEDEKLTGSLTAGYSTRYIFRGTNLMPSANGLTYTDLHASYGGFTFGAWVGVQNGGADVPGALAIGEGGGGGSVAFDITRGAGLTGLGGSAVSGQQLVNFIGNQFGLTGDDVRTAFSQVLGVTIPEKITQIKQSAEAFQDRFNEIDLYAQYSFSLGPVDITVGNIFFYIDRDSRTRVTAREYFASEDARELITAISGNPLLLPGNTRAGKPEDFLLNGGRKFSKTFEAIGDERFDRVFASVSTTAIPYIVPRVTYYQTIYNEGKNPDPELGLQRNDRKGGYLELKVNGEIPIIKNVLNLDPYALVSYSAGDRTASDGTSLDAWNHFQAGAELVFQVTENFRLIPGINYMNHIADPPLGTNKDEWWGGAKAEITF